MTDLPEEKMNKSMENKQMLILVDKVQSIVGGMQRKYTV